LADTFVANDSSAKLDGRIVETVPDPSSDWTRPQTPRHRLVAVISIAATERASS
jgi:hypothetical protein